MFTATLMWWTVQYWAGEIMNQQPVPARVGDPAPVIDLPTLDGGRVRVPPDDGGVVLLSFLRHAG